MENMTDNETIELHHKLVTHNVPYGAARFIAEASHNFSCLAADNLLEESDLVAYQAMLNWIKGV